MIDPKFRNINRMFVLSFKKSDSDPTKDSYKYYMPLVEIKSFNALTDNKPLYDQIVKNNQEKYKYNYSSTKLENDEGRTKFFVTEKKQKTIINFSGDSLNIIE